MTTTRKQAHHQIVIVGGGAAGITVAASLLRKDKSLDIAIIEPSEDHYYQPAFTFVGGGAYKLAKTKRPEVKCIPKGAKWIKSAVAEFAPEHNALTLNDGKQINYDYLVVCPGIQLDWQKIEGLQATLGRNGVCSNYLPHLAEYTWQCLREFKGGDALFTQPAMPIKCAGAPQKIMYLAADHFAKRGLAKSTQVNFCLQGEAMFGVPAFAKPLEKVAEHYGIEVDYGTNLTAIDGQAKQATFQVKNKDGNVKDITKRFDMIHVTPPQSAPDFVKQSPLADSSGWVDIDAESMQHKRYPNVFSLGDAGSSPNSKTAAAVRKQAPVVVGNLLAQMRNTSGVNGYDGYGSCPFVTSYGTVILAEFIYGGTVTPSFPLDPTLERRSMWWLTKSLLPYLYWDFMLKGHEWDIRHKPWTAPAVKSLTHS